MSRLRLAPDLGRSLMRQTSTLKQSPAATSGFSASASTAATAFPKSETAMNVFDRKAKALHRARSVVAHREDDHKVFDYLKEEVGYRVYDRILDIKRHFDTIVDLSAGKGYVGRNLTKVNKITLNHCSCCYSLL